MLTDGGRERAALVAVDVATDARPTTPEVLAERDDAELEHFALTEDGTLAALVWNAVGRSEIDLLDLTGLGTSTGVDKPTPYTPPGDVVTGVVFSHDGDCLVMGVQAPEVPAAVWCHERSSSSTALIAPTDETAWSAGALVHPALETVTTPDGLALPGWLYRPPGVVGPCPTVIYLHGGPEAQERPVFTPLYQTMLSRGIAVYAANVRGSSGFGRSFVNADNGAGRFAAIRDVATCVEHLVATGIADPDRVGCMGRSYGGYLTLAALVNHPELFAVGIDVCGMADFETFFARTEPWIADSAVGEYGHPIHDRNLLRELSPCTAWRTSARPCSSCTASSTPTSPSTRPSSPSTAPRPPASRCATCSSRTRATRSSGPRTATGSWPRPSTGSPPTCLSTDPAPRRAGAASSAERVMARPNLCHAAGQDGRHGRGRTGDGTRRRAGRPFRGAPYRGRGAAPGRRGAQRRRFRGVRGGPLDPRRRGSLASAAERFARALDAALGSVATRTRDAATGLDAAATGYVAADADAARELDGVLIPGLGAPGGR